MSDITRQRHLVFSDETVNPVSARILSDNLNVIADSVRVSNVVNREADEIQLQIENARKAYVAALNRGVQFVARNS